MFHALWKCGMAQDVWAGCSIQLQKCLSGQNDIMQLVGEGKMDKMEPPPSYMV